MNIQNHENELYGYEKPLVSVNITTWKEEEYLSLCLESIRNQTYKNIEINIVDSNSPDKTVEIAKRYTSNVIVEECKMPIGRDLAAGLAKGDIYFFIDAKVILQKDYIEKIVSCLGKKSVVAAYGELLPIPINPKNILMKVCTDIGSLLLWLTVVYDNYSKASTALGVTKEAYEKAGGFTKDFILCEDLDFAYRLNKLGKVKFVRSARGHFFPRRFENLGYKKVLREWFEGSLGYVLSRHKVEYGKKNLGKYPAYDSKNPKKEKKLESQLKAK